MIRNLSRLFPLSGARGFASKGNYDLAVVGGGPGGKVKV